MSFCRFSDDNFRCDFYAYESEQGHELYVAANQIRWDPPQNPLEPDALKLPTEEWGRIYSQYHEQLNQAPRVSITLQGAGNHTVLPSLKALRDRIAQLASSGFVAPAWLIPNLDMLLAEETQSQT